MSDRTQQWLDGQPARIAARQADRAARGPLARAGLRAWDHAIGFLTLLAVIFVFAALVILALWGIAAAFVAAWEWVGALLVVFAFGLVIAHARR